MSRIVFIPFDRLLYCVQIHIHTQKRASSSQNMLVACMSMYYIVCIKLVYQLKVCVALTTVNDFIRHIAQHSKYIRWSERKYTHTHFSCEEKLYARKKADNKKSEKKIHCVRRKKFQIVIIIVFWKEFNLISTEDECEGFENCMVSEFCDEIYIKQKKT